MAIRRNPSFDVFNLRLLVALDKLLREKRRYQGDLSASINDALLAVNLNTVKLVTLQGKKKQTARETQVALCRTRCQGRAVCVHGSEAHGLDRTSGRESALLRQEGQEKTNVCL